MKKQISSAILCAAMMTGEVRAFAGEWGSEYQDGLGVEVGIDWLYWIARRSDLDYAITNLKPLEELTTPQGSTRLLDPDYSSGFRASLRKSFVGNLRWGLIYTGYDTDSRDSVSLQQTPKNRVQAIFATRPYPGQETRTDKNYAAAHYTLDLDTLDIQVSSLCNPCFEWGPLNAFGGISFRRIDQDLKLLYEELVNQSPITKGELLKHTMQFKGVGPYLGMEGSCPFFRCFEFYAKGSTGIVITKMDRDVSIFDLENRTPTTLSAFTDDEDWNYVPTLDLSFGLQFVNENWCHIDWVFNLGYEFHSWYSLPDFLQFNNTESKALLAHNKSTLGFDGFWFHAGLVF